MRYAIVILLLLSACQSSTPDDSADANDEASESLDTLRIMAYNIHHGEGMDEVLDLERIAVLINEWNPDLIALQEMDSVVTRTNGVDQTQVLGELTGMESVFGQFMPYQGGAYGMAVMSKWPIVSSTNHRLPDGEEPRSALSIRVRSPHSGRELEFVGIHFYMTEAERLAQAETLAAVYSDVDVPVVLAGDFNSEPDSPVIALLEDQWNFVDKGDDHFTFSSYDPVKEIDFFALRPGASFRILSQSVLDEPVASDHRPLFIELVW